MISARQLFYLRQSILTNFLEHLQQIKFGRESTK